MPTTISLSNMGILNLVPLIPAMLIALLILNKKANRKNKFIVSLVIGLLAIVIGNVAIRLLGELIFIVGIFQIVLYVVVCSIISYLITAVFVSHSQPKAVPAAGISNTESDQSADQIVADINQANAAASNPMMKKCSVCGREIAKSAKACPGCGAKEKTPIYKRAWFIVIIVIVALFAYSRISSTIKDNNISRATVITNSGEIKQMTAEEIRNICDTNSILFEREYAGAEITVTSTITEIGGAYLLRSWFDCEAYIMLDASDFMTSWFRPVTEEYAASVNVGDTVTVSGKIARATVAGTDVYIFETTNSPY